LLEKAFGPVHVYDVAALTLKLRFPPEQTGLLLEGNATAAGLTTTVVVIVLVHPPAEAPIRVYTVVATGVKLIDGVTKFPGNHVYVEAPPAVKVTPVPSQTVGEFAVKVGPGVTTTVTVLTKVLLPTQPAITA